MRTIDIYVYIYICEIGNRYVSLVVVVGVVLG